MIIHGDLINVLPTLEANSVDACVTDPPYDLTTTGRSFQGKDDTVMPDGGTPSERRTVGFMGKAWDGTGIAFRPETWRAVLRVLKPGAYLVAFGGTRTSHRMVCAIEDAGFEIRDTLCWLYGSGFPKSLDVSKAIDRHAGVKRALRQGIVKRDGYGDDWDTGSSESRPRYDKAATDEAQEWDGWGTALKPGYEPITLARKPFDGTVAANVLQHGTGAMNIDSCRIPSGPDHSAKCASVVGLASNRNGSFYGEWSGTRDDSYSKLGRWPANVLLDEEAAALLDEQTGDRRRSAYPLNDEAACRYAGTKGNPADQRVYGDYENIAGRSYSDSGGASRFYYVAKPSHKERDYGCDGLVSRQRDDSRKEGNPGGDNPRNRGVHPRGNHHPTVKPVELMRWLVRLVTPLHGNVVDPFLGSGTTGMACRYENRDFVGIEKESEYIDIATRRIAAVAPLFASGE